MTKLKPCPFCGGEGLLEELIVRKGFEAVVVCAGCLVSMPTITYDTAKEAEAAAVKAWNSRADAEPVRQGEWEVRLDSKTKVWCSVCNHRRDIYTQIGWRYCPNCGARMDGE